MGPDLNPDVPAICASLTKAQREAVLILSGQWASRMRPERTTWLEPCLLEIGVPLRTGHERVRLTPLGLAVRAHLLKEQQP